MVIKKRADVSPPPLPPTFERSQPIDEQAPEHSGAETADAPSLDSADWRVVEIDGEAAPVYVASPASSVALPTDSPETLVEDLRDEVIVAGLEQRRLTVQVDETAIFRLVLLNNGDEHACFEVRVEGSLPAQWVKITPANSLDDGADMAQIWLQPGERTLLHISIMPPRASSSRAGQYAFAVVVRMTENSRRVARLGALLSVKPFVHLQLGTVRPQSLSTSWARRSAVLDIPVTNQGNTATKIYVQGQAAGARARSVCRFAFYGPDSKQPHPGRLTLTLPPSKTAHIIAKITAEKQPLLGLRRPVTPIHLAVGMADAQTAPLFARVNLVRTPLIGPWHLLSVLGVFLFSGLSMVLVAAVTAMLALGQGAAPAPLLEPASTSVPPPLVAVIVQLAQPAAPLSTAETRQPTETAGPMAVVPPAPSQPDPALPIVQLDQVSAPGETRAQAGPFLPPPTLAARQSSSATMTYRQMFQEIATRYDLNWRMLAAQAYIESSYDTLALNSRGAMGLMQVMPGTWREWSPIVNVNDPFDAYSNVMVAAVYLDYLRSRLSERGHSQTEWMLIAYNWGIDKLIEHLDAGLGWDALPAESRQYALDVLRMADTIPPN